MDPILVREDCARWQAVAEVEQAEQQQATLEDRWRKLNASLYCLYWDQWLASRQS